MSGAKIIKALEEAQRGDFARVTVAGHTWVRLDKADTLDACVRQIVRDELIRCNVVADRTND